MEKFTGQETLVHNFNKYHGFPETCPIKHFWDPVTTIWLSDKTPILYRMELAFHLFIIVLTTAELVNQSRKGVHAQLIQFWGTAFMDTLHIPMNQWMFIPDDGERMHDKGIHPSCLASGYRPIVLSSYLHINTYIHTYIMCRFFSCNTHVQLHLCAMTKVCLNPPGRLIKPADDGRKWCNLRAGPRDGALLWI